MQGDVCVRDLSSNFYLELSLAMFLCFVYFYLSNKHKADDLRAKEG